MLLALYKHPIKQKHNELVNKECEKAPWTNAQRVAHCEKASVDGGCWAFGQSVETILSELIKGEGVAG